MSLGNKKYRAVGGVGGRGGVRGAQLAREAQHDLSFNNAERHTQRHSHEMPAPRDTASRTTHTTNTDAN
ncbi:unnamed protein product [Danaus chrysippus]|uniref:(African queen) hypothetical protein n=1 Tax=Danaus chrysippus TaxID=151541 RepID=A0A8J2VXU3_9NEOP|nr:unnamed protein product [Danaus chrysippus]